MSFLRILNCLMRYQPVHSLTRIFPSQGLIKPSLNAKTVWLYELHKFLNLNGIPLRKCVGWLKMIVVSRINDGVVDGVIYTIQSHGTE